MNAPLRILIAEDELYNRKRLSRLLQEAGCQVVAELPDGPAVLEWLEAGGQADALFLDIEMPGASGLDIAQDLPRLPIVFVTAFSEHAVQAFDSEAVDYLLKPVTTERLARALQRVRERLHTQPSPPQRKVLRYPVRVGEGLLLLDLTKTTHFLYESETVWAYLNGERFRTTWKSLNEVESAFPPKTLFRAHRHLLLRVEAVQGLRAGEFGRILVRVPGGLELEVTRSAAPKLRERLGLPERGRA